MNNAVQTLTHFDSSVPHLASPALYSACSGEWTTAQQSLKFANRVVNLMWHRYLKDL